MMERSRSRKDIFGDIYTRLRDNEDEIGIVSQSDHSLFDWIPITLVGAWVAFGGAEDIPKYWRDSSGIVRMAGLIKSGAVPSAFTTLPANFRPGGNRRFPTISNGAFGYVSVLANGVCTVEAGSNVYVDLAAIAFRAEQ